MKPSSKPKAHSRFIPREEIEGVSAWRFSSVDGSDDLPPTEDDAPQAEPENLIDEARLEEVRQQAYNDGFAHGHDAGAQEMRQALEATIRKMAEETGMRMAQLMHGMREQLQRSEEQISRQILELACDLARQVLRQELQTPTAHLKPVISEALAQLVDDGLPATVRLNPDDLVLLQGSIEETLGQHKVELVGDVSISPGGCVVESPSTTVDATIEKRWTRAVGNLGLETPWHPETVDV